MNFSSLKQFLKNDRLRLFALLVVALIFSLGAEKYLASYTSVKVKTEVKGDRVTSEIEITHIPDQEVTNAPTVNPPTTPSITPQPTMTTTPISTTTPIPQQATGDFIYPGSTKISGDSSSITLQSSDSPQVITNWYKNKIKSMGLSATSFVTTSTNDNVLNKLVASNGTKEVRVEITKKSDSSIVIISLQL